MHKYTSIYVEPFLCCPTCSTVCRDADCCDAAAPAVLQVLEEPWAHGEKLLEPTVSEGVKEHSWRLVDTVVWTGRGCSPPSWFSQRSRRELKHSEGSVSQDGCCSAGSSFFGIAGLQCPCIAFLVHPAKIDVLQYPVSLFICF